MRQAGAKDGGTQKDLGSFPPTPLRERALGLRLSPPYPSSFFHSHQRIFSHLRLPPVRLLGGDPPGLLNPPQNQTSL